MEKVVTPDGLEVNDDVRLNFGADEERRMAELLAAGVCMHVVAGPGIEDEEGNGTRALARLRARSGVKIEAVRAGLPAGFSLRNLSGDV